MSRNLTGVDHLSATSPLANGGQYRSRVGQYHMSRQNPDVLDQIYSQDHASQDVGDRESLYTATHKDTSYTSSLGRPNGYHSPAIPPRMGPHPQVSLVRQMLNSRRARSASPSSLVQRAMRKGPILGTGRLLKSGVIGGSPVMVKLAGVKGLKEKQERVTARVMDASGQNPVSSSDKEAVLSALRQKRYLSRAYHADHDNCCGFRLQ